MTKESHDRKFIPKKGHKIRLSSKNRTRAAREARKVKLNEKLINNSQTEFSDRKTASKLMVYKELFLNDLTVYKKHRRSHHFLTQEDL